MKHNIILSITISLLTFSAISCTTPAVAPQSESQVLKTPNISQGYPVASRVINPETGQAVKDQYISPFRPYNPIIAKNFKSGQLAGDPSTIKVDSKTGKADKSTMKVFRLP